MLSSARARDNYFSVFGSFSNLISELRQVLQRQVFDVIGFGCLMFDVIFLAKEQKLQVLSFSEQNLMYKVFSDYILYLVGTFSPFSDVTVLMQGLTLKTSSLSMKALIAFCCNLLKENSGVYWHQEQSEICDLRLWDWTPQASSLSSVLCLVTNAITSSY